MAYSNEELLTSFQARLSMLTPYEVACLLELVDGLLEKQNPTGKPKGKGDSQRMKQDEGVLVRFRTHQGMSMETLLEIFKPYRICRPIIMNKEGNGEFTGCGSVRLSYADKACEELHRSCKTGRMFYCQSGGDDGDDRRLFVYWRGRSIAQTIDQMIKPHIGEGLLLKSSHPIDVALHVLFSRFGEVDYVVTIPCPPLPEPDRAFIKFSNRSEMQASLDYFSHQPHPCLSVRKAGPRRRQ